MRRTRSNAGLETPHLIQQRFKDRSSDLLIGWLRLLDTVRRVRRCICSRLSGAAKPSRRRP